MSVHEYRLIVGGWSILVIFLTVFWCATLNRLSEVMRGDLEKTRTRPAGKAPAWLGLAGYIFRGDFKESGDDRFVQVCKKLRSLLYAYVGSLGAYLVFVFIVRPAG